MLKKLYTAAWGNLQKVVEILRLIYWILKLLGR